jgi:hypothetical protein
MTSASEELGEQLAFWETAAPASRRPLKREKRRMMTREKMTVS